MANRHKRSSCSQATWTVSVLVLTLCLLVSQFLGFFHELYHPGFTLAPTQLGQQVSTSLSRPTFERTKQHDSESSIDLRHLLDSHFGYLGSEVCGSSNDSNAQCSNQEKQSCHLFDALSLASFISPDINSLNVQNQFDEVLFEYDHSLKTPQSVALYQSRAPPSFFL